MPFYDCGEAAVYFEMEGDGPALVLLHGYALNGVMWDLQRPVLARSNTVITVDLRGFGKSSCGKKWSGSVMAEDVSGFIRSLRVKDAAVLGFSMSGPVAFRVALDLPETVSKLILVSSILPATGRPKAGKESDLQNKELEMLRLRGPMAWAEATGLWKGPMVDRIFRQNPDAKPLWERMMSRHNPDYLLDMMAARNRTQSRVDWRSRLGDVSVPTLIIAGGEDAKFIDSARYLHRKIPGSMIRIIEGAGHMVNLEAPGEFVDSIFEFLDQYPRSSAPSK